MAADFSALNGMTACASGLFSYIIRWGPAGPHRLQIVSHTLQDQLQLIQEFTAAEAMNLTSIGMHYW